MGKTMQTTMDIDEIVSSSHTKPVSDFYVAVLTPYLSKSISEILCPKHLAIQQAKYGLEIDALQEFSNTRAPKTKLHLYIIGDTPPPDRKLDLIINGSTEAAEEEVEELKGSGIIVARYSIFYGGPSGYSGKTPEQGGYALDIPKNMNAVIRMLSSEPMLDAMRDGNSKRIKQALARLNKTIDRPVLATPYLREIRN